MLCSICAQRLLCPSSRLKLSGHELDWCENRSVKSALCFYNASLEGTSTGPTSTKWCISTVSGGSHYLGIALDRWCWMLQYVNDGNIYDVIVALGILIECLFHFFFFFYILFRLDQFFARVLGEPDLQYFH